MNRITFKEVGIDGIAAIIDLASRSWPFAFEDILSPAQIDYMMDMMYSEVSLTEQIVSKDHHYVIIMDLDKELGYASYQPNYPEVGQMKLHKIYLLPDYKGRGYGKALLLHIISISRSMNMSPLYLNVNRNNKAIAFYQHLGFEIERVEDIDIGHGYLMEDYVMKKSLL